MGASTQCLQLGSVGGGHYDWRTEIPQLQELRQVEQLRVNTCAGVGAPAVAGAAPQQVSTPAAAAAGAAA